MKECNRAKRDVKVLAFLSLLFVGPYFVFPSGWFGDDAGVLSYAQQNARGGLRSIFLYKDSIMGRYRPLMQMLATVSVRHFGFNTILIRIASYCALLTTLATLWALLRRLKFTNAAALLAPVWFAAVPIKIQAIARPGRPEIFVTAFCLLAVLCLEKTWETGGVGLIRIRRTLWYCLCLLLAVGAALWAEMGISVFIVLGVWTAARLFFLTDGINEKRPRVRAVFGRLLLPVLGILIYAGWYRAVGAPIIADSHPCSRYEIHLGLETVWNIAAAVACTGSPVAAPVAARIAHRCASIQDSLACLLGAAAVVTVSLLVIHTLRRERRTVPAAACLACCAIASLFPFALFKHVSEVYLTQASAFMSACAGVGIAATLRNLSPLKSRIFLIATGTLVAVMVATSINAFLLLRKNANVFMALYSESVRHRHVDGNQCIVLIPPCAPLFKFSQYYLPYNSILLFKDARMPRVTWLTDCNAKPDVGGAAGIVYRVDLDGRMHPYTSR